MCDSNYRLGVRDMAFMIQTVHGKFIATDSIILAEKDVIKCLLIRLPFIHSQNCAICKISSRLIRSYAWSNDRIADRHSLSLFRKKLVKKAKRYAQVFVVIFTFHWRTILRKWNKRILYGHTIRLPIANR